LLLADRAAAEQLPPNSSKEDDMRLELPRIMVGLD